MVKLNSPHNRIRELFGPDCMILEEKEILHRLGIAPLSDAGGTVDGFLGRIFGKNARQSKFGTAVVERRSGANVIVTEVYYYPREYERELVKQGLISATEHELELAGDSDTGFYTERVEATAAANAARRK